MLKGQSKFAIDKNITIGQDKNGMHWAEIKDNGIIQSVILRKTSNNIYKELKERGLLGL